MKFILKDYQSVAVAATLKNFAEAREDFHQRDRNVSFALSATTGAGKTVIAAAVIEALFFGSEDFDFEPDPTAVVLWFTDDPSLNEQTRFKLLEAGDRLKHSQLKVIEPSFNQRKLEASNIYFLNSQKLSKNSMLVRGAPVPGQEPISGYKPLPDDRAFTMWDTIANTIGDDKLTLYLILDEAHRGMKKPTAGARTERATIVKRMVNGDNAVPPIPVVWGISATIERFTEAMANARDRTAYPACQVDPALVQESGLLKDDILLDFPAEAGDFDTVLLARGVRKTKRAHEDWAKYLVSQGERSDKVAPLLVVQMPNKPSGQLLALAVSTVFDAWPDLPRDAIAHVFGEHKPIEVGNLEIPHISPEMVQDTSHVRVLLAKDAISTGWDCPRAEVLVSFRPAKDQTHITQLLGRMVRTPLARRIDGNDSLNAVECVLPKFDRETATKVAEILVGQRDGDEQSGGSGGGDGRRVLFAPQEFYVNPAIPKAVWEAFDALQSQTLPRAAMRPTKRFVAFAQALSRDGLMEDARKAAFKELMAVLDGYLARHSEEVDKHVDQILEVEGETIVTKVDGGERTVEKFVEIADAKTVEAEYRLAKRLLTPDLARDFAERIAEADGDDDGLLDAHLKVASLASIEGIQESLDEEADKLFDKWYAKHRVEIKGLSDERQAAYRNIIAMSSEPEFVDIKRPTLRIEETMTEDDEPVETRPLHLLSDATGQFPIGSLNDWETAVLDSELARSDVLAWYRNPARGSDDSLTIAYLDEAGNWRRLCPDFLFFHGDEKDVKVSIIDPHGYHFADAMPKLRGLAAFAVGECGESFHRIEAIARMRDKKKALRVLDLKDDDVRAEIRRDDMSAEALYESDAASNYLGS